MTVAQTVVTRREDYKPSAWQINQIELDFDIGETEVEVRATLHLHCSSPSAAPLLLDGRQLELLGLQVDGARLDPSQYQVDEQSLRIDALPRSCRLQIRTRINPYGNTSLEGLYAAGDMLCTQCEAHGFSRITYFLDRPDVLARYTVTLTADVARFPVLLSNGNRIESETLDNGRHRVVWQDPYPKPCYLFALVAGDLAQVKDHYRTQAGRHVDIEFYVEHGRESLCGHAIDSLKQAMTWDEQTYGLEYDLDLYMVVAVSSFNMGAMENKGLNIFNDRYVLVSPETATDTDYESVTAVIGHEYFHNWTGNRVTCRDWFQLSLKEGLTVFREQQFMEHTAGASTQRIEQVRQLRERQFTEDAGPLAHPVRPDSYIEVNNFYTATVYEKGAELVRMLQRLLGQGDFAKGLGLYLATHDGSAATIEDFIQALQAQTRQDLTQFMHWYDQAGTPRLVITATVDASKQQMILSINQQTPATPGQPHKLPLPIPLSIECLDSAGSSLSPGQPRIQTLYDAESEIIIEHAAADSVPVFLHGFSAPVLLNYDYKPEQLGLIVTHARDGYVRWQAMQSLYLQHLLGEECLPVIVSTAQAVLDDESDAALLTELLSLPSENQLIDSAPAPVNLEYLLQARDSLQQDMAHALSGQLTAVLDSVVEAFYSPANKAQRQLRAVALRLLMQSAQPDTELAVHCYHKAQNMTEALAAMQSLRDVQGEARTEVLNTFRQRWDGNMLVLDKWFSLQATTRFGNGAARVRGLMTDIAFELRNPNRVRALLGAFFMHNPRGLHARDESGYSLLKELLLQLDRLNPQVSARLAQSLSNWRRLDSDRQKSIDQLLEDLLRQPGLSADLYEILMKMCTNSI